ncbi:hypothetical protein EBM89_18595 [Cellulomonas triticagri]|uniref:PrgI family protein n=1 Tax=Cellulomonas triticagri TaxID=2483352 RepID=A0A3M2IRD0_9CELL|nr:hypothetical protein EBM89_18595 [Cellulomonas triticagri]
MFAPVSRSGVVAGLSGGQLALVAIGLSRPVWSLIAAGDLAAALASALWWTLPVLVLACGSYKGRSFLERVSVVGLFGLRKVMGQTRTVVRVGAGDRAGAIAIPGALGERLTVLDMVGTVFDGGCFLWDKVTQQATVVLRVTTHGWALASAEQKATRASGLTNLCQTLAAAEGVVQVVKHARTYPGTPPAVGTPTPGDLGSIDAAELADHPAMTASLTRDDVITITVAAPVVSAQVDAAGGGVEGLSWVLGDRVAQLLAGLPECGVRTEDAAWWSPAQIRAAVRLAFDPSAADMLAAAGWCLDADAVLATVADERYDHLVTDSGVHRTFWVEKWPAVPARAGFLSNLVATGTVCRTFTQMWRPGAVHSAEKRLRNAEASHSSASAVNAKLGRPESVAHHAQGKDLARRRGDLEAGFADVSYSGWITLTAADTEALRVGELWLRSTAKGLELKLLRGDQWAAFCTAALPLGIGPRA